MTACRRFIDSTAVARCSGSTGSSGGGARVVPTAQNLHARVHSWPAIMNVASPLAQHSWMFGHLASWQTVWRALSLTADLVSLNMACCLPFGRVVLNQLGNRSRFFLGRDDADEEVAIVSCLPVMTAPPHISPCYAHQKGVPSSLRRVCKTLDCK